MLHHILRAAAAAGAAGGVIEFVGAKTVGIEGQTADYSLSLTGLTGGLAAAPEAGDFVLIYFSTTAGVDRDLVVAGYVEVGELYSNDSQDANLVAAWKFMGGTPDTTATITGGTQSAVQAGAFVVQVWRGVDPTTPINTYATATGINSALANPASITPTVSGSVISVCGAGGHASFATQTYSSSDLTDFRSVGANDDRDTTIGGGYYAWTSGAFDPAAFTFSGSDDITYSWAAFSIALNPA